MITKKELQFVDAWATKIPMPGIEYSSEAIDKVEECYETYEKKYKNKEYNIIFSNKEEITFEILPSNLCHMFGIDYNNIKDPYFKKYRKSVLKITNDDFTSLELLEAILNNKDKVIEKDNDINSKAKILNYYKLQIKSDIFRKLSDFEKFNFAAINPDFMQQHQELLFIPSNESNCPYFMTGIIPKNPNKIEQKYVVNTLLAPTDVEKFFNNQEVIIPIELLISDNDQLKKTTATAEDKLKLLTMYKNIITTYNIKGNLNICGDYEMILNELSIKENDKKYKK